MYKIVRHRFVLLYEDECDLELKCYKCGYLFYIYMKNFRGYFSGYDEYLGNNERAINSKIHCVIADGEHDLKNLLK